ncbi:MAG: phosphotransacetylase family protein [Dehalococcoidales bacterium]|nr:phosphotransacetylase family protein [Dehalococcoidales bacterium]
MGVLYVVSAEEASGKTAVCAGLAANIMNDGKKAGYLKPQVAEKDGSDSDIAFMKQVLGQTDAVNAPDIIKGRDVVLVEAMVGQTPDDALSKDTYGAVKEMQAKVIAVEAYTGGASKYIEVYKGFGDSLLGVVINKVPESKLKQVREEAGAEDIKVLGVIPENRTLLAVTVGELAEKIQGKILNNPEKAAELVENYMLGAMVVDSGLDYFGRKTNKAAIVRQDRPDMQLAALETSTRCLVLTGSGEPPVYNVLQKAEARGIPVVATEKQAPDIVAGLEDTLLAARLNQEKKLSRLAEVVRQNLDIKAVV